LDAGDKQHGCTVHYVTAELDGGATILQHSIDIHPEETADGLATRLLEFEQSLYVEALNQVARQLLI